MYTEIRLKTGYFPNLGCFTLPQKTHIGLFWEQSFTLYNDFATLQNVIVNFRRPDKDSSIFNRRGKKR